MRSPSLKQLSVLFFRIGNITFGGGDPTMAALQRELVSRQRWLAGEHYGLAYSMARITPGTNLLAFCAATGWYLRGWFGAILGVMTVTLPSAALVVWLTHGYGAWRHNALVMAAVSGMLAAAVGMMAASAILLIRPFLRKGGWPRTLFFVVGAALLSWKAGVSPIPILAAAALTGFVWRGRDAQ